jgi:2-polyprenyl-3-methyl-5-hydroxy-6-metoxy-1,4-benzoquinol methylase
MPEPQSPPRKWTPASIRELATAFQASRVLLTGVELRIFSLIGTGGLTSADVAAKAGCHPRATDRLLNALCALGLLEKRDGRFHNTADTLRYLVDSSPEYAAGLGHTISLWDTWSGLTGSVRSGSPAVRRAINDRGDNWLEPFIAAMHHRARVQADQIAAMLPAGPASRALDVGGGSGAFSIAMARRHPGLRAVVFDLPNVVPLTQRYVAEAGLTDAVTTATGDYLADSLPGGFDLVFLSAVVHSNSAGTNASLIRKCAASLQPGGHLALLDWVMSPDRVLPAAGAMFALNMLVGTDEGDTFTEAEISGWMAGAGLTGIERRTTPFGTDLLTATRPHAAASIR